MECTSIYACVAADLYVMTLNGLSRARMSSPRRPLSEQLDITGCLYAARRLNPWLPQEPGKHGYMFIKQAIPSEDVKQFMTSSTRALFINESEGLWRYHGQYVVARNPESDLTVEEWSSFSDMVGHSEHDIDNRR